jgi:hypothetical protein
MPLNSPAEHIPGFECRATTGKERIDLDSLSDHVVTETLVSISERRSRRQVGVT